MYLCNLISDIHRCKVWGNRKCNQSWELLWLILIITTLLSTVVTFNLRIYKNYAYLYLDQSSLQHLTGYDYHADYQIKIKLICRLKRRSSIDLDIHITRVNQAQFISNENIKKNVNMISGSFYRKISFRMQPSFSI